MKWWALVLLVAAGCGSSSPTDSPEVPPPGQVPLVTIRVEEFNTYLSEVRRTYLSIPVMVDDFESINQGWAQEFLSVYWTEQFMRNLLTRVELIREQVRAIRPEHPDLLEIHGEYEEGLELYEKAFRLFLEQVPVPYPGSIDPVNVNLGQGNIRIGRFQASLSDLVGQQVVLLPT